MAPKKDHRLSVRVTGEFHDDYLTPLARGIIATTDATNLSDAYREILQAGYIATARADESPGGLEAAIDNLPDGEALLYTDYDVEEYRCDECGTSHPIFLRFVERDEDDPQVDKEPPVPAPFLRRLKCENCGNEEPTYHFLKAQQEEST